MKVQTRTTIAVFAAAVLALLLLCVFCQRPNSVLAEKNELSFATTDRLYFYIPGQNKEQQLTTLGGYVNGYYDEERQDPKSDSFSVNSWYDIYMKRKGGWKVSTSDKVGDKYYYDQTKYPINDATLYLEIKSLPVSENLLAFIWNDTDMIFYRRGAPKKEDRTLCRGTCSDLGHAYPMKFEIKKEDSVPFIVNIPDKISYNNDDWKPNKGDKIGDFSWKIDGPEDFSTGFGIQPKEGEYILCSSSDFVAAKYRIDIEYLFGAVCQPKSFMYGRAQTAHFVMPDSSYHYKDHIDFTAYVDTAKPDISVSAQYNKDSIFATWIDDSFSVATYSYNGGNPVEYIERKSLKEEGRYEITVTDSVGKIAVETVYVDRSPPLFDQWIYDAQGKEPELSSKSCACVSWQQASINESPIKSCTYVRRYYNSATNSIIEEEAKEYTANTNLYAEGKYIFTLEDCAGNKAHVTYIVDKTDPVIKTEKTASKYSVSATSKYTDVEAAVSMTYSFNGGTDQPYRSGQDLTTEGQYVITATDRAGNFSKKTLYVDKTAPVLSPSFKNGQNNGYVAWSVGKFESPITAKYSFVGEGGTEHDKDYNLGQLLNNEGKYTIVATDEAGNKATAEIIIDRTAPVVFFADGTFGNKQNTKNNSSVSFSNKDYESPIEATYSFESADENKSPSVGKESYKSGTTFTAEGKYSFTVTDEAGNVSTAKVIIDRTKPVITFENDEKKIFDKYTNTAFTAKAFDALSGIKSVEIYENGRYVLYDSAARRANGPYKFKVTDEADNSLEKTAVIYCTQTYGNAEAIRQKYKINAWYTVNLPARIFTTDSRDIAGTYSFESFDKALDFAVAKEREFRVVNVQGGYMYVAVNNESVAQKYTDERALNTAVEKYAKGYIAARKTAGSKGNDRYYNEPESLTRNSPVLPQFLSEYKNSALYLINSSAAWRLPDLSYIAEMPYTVTAQYLGDFAEERGEVSNIPVGSAFVSALGDKYKQGYYLITESDVAGNCERYLVYSDAQQPTARVHAVLGNGEKDIVIDHAYTQNETMYFLSLSFEALYDNIDDFVTLKIEKGNSVKYYAQSDGLPTLGSDEFKSGKYTVTVFDRSLNALDFSVYIAGAQPNMTHGSLVADKQECRISFVTSDKFNVITGITLYKIEYNGDKTVLEKDGLGVAVSEATLSYTLTVGGKYGATIYDNFCRTVEIDPIFFLKGLPAGTLSGVADGGRTKNNVSFTFDESDACELYVLLPGGEKRRFYDYTVQTGSSNKTYNITADNDTSHEYLVFLHNAQDKSLYVEYTFEIDTILPEFFITDSEGNAIRPDGATNKPFRMNWQETGVSARYYTARSGQMGAVKYNMNTELSQGTLYYFTLRDDVGNSRDFTVLLDNAVDYILDGTYTEVDGVMYANSQLSLTVNEPTQKFSIQNVDGYTIENGGAFTQAGRYDITVTDNYRNTVRLAIVLDFTPPAIDLVGVSKGAAVNGNVEVYAADYDHLYLADGKGNKLRDIVSGETFTDAGNYRIIARDHAGNVAVTVFSIDLSVDYVLSVPSGAVTTEKVSLDTAEQLDISVMFNGENIEPVTKFSEYGEYELTLTDELGNSAFCVFTVIPGKAQTLEQTLPIGTRVVRVLRNGEEYGFADPGIIAFDTTGVYVVTLDCGGTPYELTVETDNTPPAATLEQNNFAVKIAAVDKENAYIKLLCDGSETDGRIGQTINDPGHYVLIVTDELGNENVYEFDIPFRLNTWSIFAIVAGVIALSVVVVLVIRARKKPRIK